MGQQSTSHYWAAAVILSTWYHRYHPLRGANTAAVAFLACPHDRNFGGCGTVRLIVLRFLNLFETAYGISNTFQIHWEKMIMGFQVSRKYLYFQYARWWCWPWACLLHSAAVWGFIRHDLAELCSLMIPSAMHTRTGASRERKQSKGMLIFIFRIDDRR